MLLDGEVIVRVVALSVAILVHMNKVAIRDAINAHLHDRFVTHAHLHASVAAGAVAVLAAWVLALAPGIPHLPHTVLLIIVVIRLAARALRAQMLI